MSPSLLAHQRQRRRAACQSCRRCHWTGCTSSSELCIIKVDYVQRSALVSVLSALTDREMYWRVQIFLWYSSRMRLHFQAAGRTRPPMGCAEWQQRHGMPQKAGSTAAAPELLGTGAIQGTTKIRPFCPRKQPRLAKVPFTSSPFFCGSPPHGTGNTHTLQDPPFTGTDVVPVEASCESGETKS